MRRVGIIALLTSAFIAVAQQQSTQLTIPAIFAEGGITGRAPEAVQWSPDGKRVSYVLRDDAGEHGALYYVDISTGEPAVLVAQEKLSTLVPPTNSVKDERERERLQRYSVAGYHWAPDSKHLLFDSHGQLWYYSLDTKTAVQITSSTDPSADPKFSPDGKHVAYVRKHELYVRPLDRDRDEETQVSDGKDGKGTHIKIDISLKDEKKKKDEPGPDDILNGEVDWVYAEELGVRSNYFWAPDGKHLAYLQMDETKVPTYPIEDFIPINATVDNQKYPKPGDANPAVRIGVVGSGGGRTRWINVPGEHPEQQDIYIPRFGWVRPGLLWVQVLDRTQKKLDLYFVDTDSGRSRAVLSETDPAWVDVTDDFTILSSGDRFLWSSWRDGYIHLYLYSFAKENPLAADAKLERQLTRGEFDDYRDAFNPQAIKAVDEKTGTVYYESHATGANAADPREVQIWSVKLSGGEPVRVSREPGTHSASFSEASADYYVDRFSSLMEPPRMSLCKVDGTCLKPFWSSHAVEPYGLTPPKFLEFTAADGKTKLYGELTMPAPSAGASAKIPLIVYLYGGSAAQVVTNSWGGTTFLFHQILAQRGYAVFSVDNRGTPGRGRAFESAPDHKSGPVEIADQLLALKQLLAADPQLDAARVGIWGWSNGGSLTLYAMTHSDPFRAGISVAPVTDPRDYDSIYIERALGLPKDNPEGYKASNVVAAAADLKGRLLEVHGTSDDNVHMQNTIQMINALIDANKQFDLMLYPRKTHGIAGSTARTNLFEKMVEHWDRWLK